MQSRVEKLVQLYAQGTRKVRSGDYVSLQPQHCMTHDNTAAVLQKYRASFSGYKIKNRRQPVFTIDHNIQDTSATNLQKYRDMQEFAKEHEIDFYGAGRGIGHQVVVEEGYALPNTLMVASDSHSNMYGGVGCLGTPVVRSDAVGLWVGGRSWWVVPQVVKCELTGQLPSRVTGKDVIIALCSHFNQDNVLNCAIEFSGSGIAGLSVDDRLAIANMTTEWGAVAGLFPADSVLLEWYQKRNKYFKHVFADYKLIKALYTNVPSVLASKLQHHPRVNDAFIQSLEQQVTSGQCDADQDAQYHKELTLDLSSIGNAYVSGPNAVKTASRIDELERKKVSINKAYLVSCTNSRASDIYAAAEIFRQSNSRIAPGVEMYIAAASSEVQNVAEQSGDWQTLLDAGCTPLPPGCGPCIGLGTGLLKDGEVGISATNRNFKGRMGSRKADTYLSSPAVVASSAISGFICSPQYLLSQSTHLNHLAIATVKASETVASITQTSEVQEAESTVYGFDNLAGGSLLYCHADNLNTDGIYPGKFTYQDGLTPEQMANVAMENYDPLFQSIAMKGDILVGGKNFGSGSSREQAATCLKFRGIKMIIAYSFSDIFKRNAFNNGLICIECPELIRALRAYSASDSQLTVRTGHDLKADFARGELTAVGQDGITSKYSIPRLGQVAQELIVSGGLELWIKKFAT